jgi:AcrR family transcriptional regulator
MGKHAESKRSDILAAAKALMWERGYEAMTPRALIERSGAGQGSLYHHFDGKLDVALAALEEIKAEETAAVEAMLASSGAPLERLETYLSRERHALRGCRMARFAHEPQMEDPRFRAPISAYLDRVRDLLEATAREAIDGGALSRRMEPAALAAALLAIVEGAFVLARSHWDEERLRRTLDAGRALLAALRP